MTNQQLDYSPKELHDLFPDLYRHKPRGMCVECILGAQDNCGRNLKLVQAKFIDMIRQAVFLDLNLTLWVRQGFNSLADWFHEEKGSLH